MLLLCDLPRAKSPCAPPRRKPQVRIGCAQMQNSENPRLLKRGRPPRLHRGLILSASLFAFGWTGFAFAQQVPPAAAESQEESPAPDAPGEIAAPTPPPADVILPEVEQIIGDDEFDDAIPPISAEDDPELDRPLESIAEFERRQAAERAADTSSDGDGPPSVDGTPVPALADGDAVEAIGDAPITDSELA